GYMLKLCTVVYVVIVFLLLLFLACYQDEFYTFASIQAVLSLRPTRRAVFDAGMISVSQFGTLEEASALSGENSRVCFILA
ncbi:glycine--tRNA ligase subunit beta, partial [Salmonella enterica subsp. enterica serovar Infantis]